MKHFYKIDVHGRHGYSFLVATREQDERSILEAALEKHLFDAEEDIHYASSEEVEEDDYDYIGLRDTLTDLDAPISEPA